MQRVCKTCLLLPQYFRVHEEDIGQSPHFLVGFFEGTRLFFEGVSVPSGFLLIGVQNAPPEKI
jgi:hypothetical protein